MIDLYGVLQEQETVNGELGLGVDYYKGEKGEQGIPGKDGKDGSDQVYVGADEPTDERVKLWIDTDAIPPSKTVSWDEIENKPEIPAPYTLPTASTSTLGGVKVDGNTITIADGVISSVGSTEPDAYIKDASVSGNTLTLTKKDDTEVVFTPSGGSPAVQGYAFTSGKTLTDEDKAHILEIQSNPLIPMYINGSLVSKIYSGGNYIQFRVVEIKGVGNDCFSVYSVNYNQSGITSNELNLQMQWYIASSNGTIDGELITSYNLKDQIKQNAGWSYTTNSSESDLYNAKEMVLIGTNAMNENFQKYYNFSYESNQNEACLGSDYQNITYTITVSNSNNITWHYNGSSIDTSAVIQLILYKT